VFKWLHQKLFRDFVEYEVMHYDLKRHYIDIRFRAHVGFLKSGWHRITTVAAYNGGIWFNDTLCCRFEPDIYRIVENRSINKPINN
jgi:hypothetical protein